MADQQARGRGRGARLPGQGQGQGQGGQLRQSPGARGGDGGQGKDLLFS